MQIRGLNIHITAMYGGRSDRYDENRSVDSESSSPKHSSWRPHTVIKWRQRSFSSGTVIGTVTAATAVVWQMRDAFAPIIIKRLVATVAVRRRGDHVARITSTGEALSMTVNHLVMRTRIFFVPVSPPLLLLLYEYSPFCFVPRQRLFCRIPRKQILDVSFRFTKHTWRLHHYRRHQSPHLVCSISLYVLCQGCHSTGIGGSLRWRPSCVIILVILVLNGSLHGPNDDAQLFSKGRKGKFRYST